MAWWFTGYDSAADPAVRALADLTAALTAPRNMTPFEEAVARFDRGLPLLEEHIEILFGISARTISRHLRPSGRTTTRGKKWFSPEQVLRRPGPRLVDRLPAGGRRESPPTARSRRSWRS